MKDSTKHILISFIMLLIFGLIELIIGVSINSISIVTNALKNLITSFMLGLSYFFEKMSERKRNYKHTFGYKRYSLLGALILSLAFLELAILIISTSIGRIINPTPVDEDILLIVAIFGFVLNIIMVQMTKKPKSLNEEAVNLHISENLLTWIGLLGGSVIIYVTDLYIIDPIISLVITLIIFIKVIKHIREITDIFLQKVPEEFDLKIIRTKLISIEKVKEVYDMHLWATDKKETNFTAHILISKNTTKKETHELKNDIKKQLKKMGIEHTTLEFDYEEK